jgi:mannose-6-phosphate isomerase-like protein (cupin superfamily)
MSYGLTLDQVQSVNQPKPLAMPWGTLTRCTDTAKYSLYRVGLHQGASQPLHLYADGPRDVFVEDGQAIVRRLDRRGRATDAVLEQGTVLHLQPLEVHAFSSIEGAELYVFGPSGAAEAVLVESPENVRRVFSPEDRNTLPKIGEPTTDRREKYWGSIETIAGGEVAAKRIFVRKDGQSSLEFHVHKYESYWIQSGVLKVGLRVGRAENHSLVLRAGESYDITPGVMHMRIALEDTVIIEVSTRDSDADSFLVEDGQTYQHIETAKVSA